MSNLPEMHPSGMPLERWHYPFKTDEERELVIKWNKKHDKESKRKQMDALEPAPF